MLGMAAQSVSALADDARAALAERPLSADRLPGDQLLLGAGNQEAAGQSLDEVDPELLETYEKLGISLNEQKMLAGVAVDAIFDSVSVGTTMKAELAKSRDHLLLVRRSGARASRARARSISARSSRIATISSPRSTARCSRDGSFVYIPKGVRCPMELSTYFRINAADTGQFERTLIVADEGASVSYLEGCTAPKRDDEPAARRGGRAGRARRRDDQVFDRAELVCRRRGRQGRHLQLRHQARQVRWRRTPRFRGRRSRPARRSRGSIRA